MKKIGGDFEFNSRYILGTKNTFLDLLKPYCFELFDSGRSALLKLLNLIAPKTILLPNFICQSIINIVTLQGSRIVYYEINADLTINVADLKSKLKNVDLFYFINYFGTVQPLKDLAVISKICTMEKIMIIEDTTHSIFSKRMTIGDYCLASLRKWFALPDGGILYSKKMFQKEANLLSNNQFTDLRMQAMHKKEQSLLLSSSDEYYLQLFQKAESILDNIKTAKRISNRSEKMLFRFDIEKMISQRRNNLTVLEKKLNNPRVKPILKFKESEVPLVYPVHVKNRGQFKNYLYKYNIYCPIHWPVEEIKLKNSSCLTLITNNIISIILDYRYSIEDMHNICAIINSYTD